MQSRAHQDGLQQLTQNEFAYLRDFIHENFGIHLVEEKKLMLESRLRGVVRKRGYHRFADYIEALKARQRGMLSELLDTVSTNLTYFWREPAHFEFFRKELEGLASRAKARNHSPKLRTWCAAASRGHEPYTLAILLREHFGPSYKSWDAGVLGTDISEKVLTEARTGIYQDEEVSTLPKHWLRRHVQPRPDGRWEMSDEVKRDVLFRRFNLMNNLPFREPFDVIFCRNVLIYFTQETRLEVGRRLCGHLHPGGYVIVGLAESLPVHQLPLELVQTGVYRRLP